MSIKKSDIIQAAIEAKRKAFELQECFDPNNKGSRPNDAQWKFFKDTGKVPQRYIVAGNGCLAKGTMIATPNGPVTIEDIKVGDIVYSEHGTPISVLKTFNTGRKEVVEITNRGIVWAESTNDHVWQLYTPYENLEEKKVSDFGRDDIIVRKELKLPLGTINCPYAYSLGALLGDGCGTVGSKNRIIISSADEPIVAKVADEMACAYRKNQGNNYNWSLWIPSIDKPELYKKWCEHRKAHEKIVDMSIIRQWDRESLLQFVAGLIDTDGSVRLRKGKSILISLSMQAKVVVEAFQYACLALWQTPTNLLVDDREKYVNGPVYEVSLSSNAFTKRILKELSPYLQCERKQWKPEYEDFIAERSTSDRVGYKLKQRRITETYDIHVSSDTNLYCLANGLVTHNSGKSAVGGRELAWLITDTHPYWNMPEDWKERPLQVLVIGKSRSILENELWLKKIKPFFAASDWREFRSGSSLQAVEHREKGHRIIFLTHSDGSQKAIDNLQAYDADIVWLDEMPSKLAVLEETQRRARRPGTIWFATFTPKSINIKIRKLVEAAKEPTSKRYRMSRLDVPGVDIKTEMEKLSGLTEAQKRTILEGDWAVGDTHVFEFDAERMLVSLPSDYSREWRHVESVDPGSNRGGLTIWAEHPRTKIWFCVKAEYIDGLRDPVAFYDYCQEVTSRYNIVRRICDPAATPHIGHAAARKCTPPYSVPFAKNQGRKEELMKNTQKLLSNGKIKIVEGVCADLVDEFSNAQRNDAGKIINSHAYHLVDSVNYFGDLIPKPVDEIQHMSRDEWILKQDDKRRAAEAREAEKQNKKKTKQQIHKTIMKLYRGRRWTR